MIRTAEHSLFECSPGKWLGGVRLVWYFSDQRGRSIFHINLATYHGPTDQNGIWFWKENEGWFWTRKDIWPFLWQQDTANWLYHFGFHGIGPTFWDYQGEFLLRW